MRRRRQVCRAAGLRGRGAAGLPGRRAAGLRGHYGPAAMEVTVPGRLEWDRGPPPPCRAFPRSGSGLGGGRSVRAWQPPLRAPQPGSPLVSPSCPRLSPSRLSGSFTASFYTISHMTDPLFSSSFSRRSFLCLIPRKGFYL